MTTKVKGSHVRLDKEKLTDNELKILKLLDSSFSLTSEDVAKQAELDIRKTTFALSELVGLDLVQATNYSSIPSNLKTGEFSSTAPRYSIPTNSPEQKRANVVIVYNGVLSKLKDPDIDWGKEKLWPYRDIDRVELGGEVQLIDGKYKLKFWGDNTQKKYEKLVGKELRITVEVVDKK